MVQLEDTSSNFAATTPSNLNTTSELLLAVARSNSIVVYGMEARQFTNAESRIIRVYHLRYYFNGTWLGEIEKFVPNHSKAGTRWTESFSRQRGHRMDGTCCFRYTLVLLLIHDHGLC